MATDGPIRGVRWPPNFLLLYSGLVWSVLVWNGTAPHYNVLFCCSSVTRNKWPSLLYREVGRNPGAEAKRWENGARGKSRSRAQVRFRPWNWRCGTEKTEEPLFERAMC